MRTVLPGSKSHTSMLGDYLSNMSEAMAVRRANAEAKRARLEAELSIKARSDFLANMNHELRTPLNAIIGFSTMLKSEGEYSLNEEKRVSYAQYILQSADLLLGHINTILEVAALDGDKIEIESSDVDLREILANVVKKASIAAEAANITIIDKTSSEDIGAFADENRIVQAVDHLIRTSIKLSKDNGEVLVRAAMTPEGWGEIAIRDKGEGFKAADLNKVLNVFGEVHRGLDRSFSGPGVDLAIAKTFVELQGGKFKIKSKPGEGTLVRISFPPPMRSADSTEENNDLAMTG